MHIFLNKKCFNLLSFKVLSIRLENLGDSQIISILVLSHHYDRVGPYDWKSFFLPLSLCCSHPCLFAPYPLFISSGFHETATFISLVFSFLSTCPNHFHILFLIYVLIASTPAVLLTSLFVSSSSLVLFWFPCEEKRLIC